MFFCNKLNEFWTKTRGTCLQIWNKLRAAVAFKPNKWRRAKKRKQIRVNCWRKKATNRNRTNAAYSTLKSMLSTFSSWKLNFQEKAFASFILLLTKKFEKFEISFRSIRLRAATGSIDAVTHAQFNFELHFTDIFICCMSKPYPMEFNGKRETKEFSSGVSPNQISLQNSALNRKVVEELSGCSGDSMELSCFCFKMQQQMIRSWTILVR